jgi:2-methylcitrate dehydratase PrpD
MITEKLAHFVVETKAKDIPSDAIKAAQAGITDMIGVALLGSKEPHGKMIMDFAKKMGGGATQASVIGGAFKTSTYMAALANGTIGHALDYDDIGGWGHPSVVLAPAILAIGEELGASGMDVLTAYVVGWELAYCVHAVAGDAHYKRGWHVTNTSGTLGAAAAAAWLLKLNEHQVRMALGIAASLAGGSRQNFGTMTKPLHAGRAAASGIQAALLAQAGFTADENIIDAPLGWAKVFGHNEAVDWAKASDYLGKTYKLASFMRIKPYPACGGTHCSIDAALFLKKEYGIKIEDISEVELGVNPFVKQLTIHHRPRTGLEGKFSLEYTVARALISGGVGLKHLTDEGVNEPEVKSLIEKMKWVEKYPMPTVSVREGMVPYDVTVKLKDGKTLSREVKYPKGDPENPLTPEELNYKYRDCASTVLSDADVEKSLRLLSDLRAVKKINELVKIVVKNR